MTKGSSALFQVLRHTGGSEPTKGMSRKVSSDGTAPSSPPAPWRATKATSGRSVRRVSTRFSSASRASTLWPLASRASTTCLPLASEKRRSKEEPPMMTATVGLSMAHIPFLGVSGSAPALRKAR